MDVRCTEPDSYTIKVATGDLITAGTISNIYIVLVGVNGETPKHKLDNWGKDFILGAVDVYSVDCQRDIGDILCVRLYKEDCFASDSWFCKYVAVTSPGGDTYLFPCYQWLSGTTTLEIPEGKGRILVGDVHPVTRQQRENELDSRRSAYRWHQYSKGVPYSIHVEKVQDLPPNDQLSATKTAGLLTTGTLSELEIKLKGLSDCQESWKNLTEMQKVFYLMKTKNSDFISEKWQLDSFFGYQYLNGPNPTQIRKCTKIPDNFPVNDEMVAATLTPSNLNHELQNGNLFMANYKILQGIPANTINGKLQYIAAPLCLLWKSPKNQILPIAIQLAQTPGEDVPIFLPSDSEWDWTLAKMWVRNADFQVHEAITRFLCVHLIAEVFSISTSRQLPMGHPVHKISSSGSIGLKLLAEKAMENLTYNSLCLPANFKHRGLDSIPNYFYHDDGMKIWCAIEGFVSHIVHYYYKNEEVVLKDPELQAWVAEIYRKGFLENKNSGVPSSLKTRSELTRYLTMIIYSCSAKHAAVNSSQFDFYSWMPNAPTSMRKPPPTEKGTATLQSILETLPQVNTTAKAMSLAWFLSKGLQDLVSTCMQRNEKHVVPCLCCIISLQTLISRRAHHFIICLQHIYCICLYADIADPHHVPAEGCHILYKLHQWYFCLYADNADLPPVKQMLVA
uniref:Uncharacterized protein n=1 Tax=Leptobrachium leishanense TaxID=445787 RepID=A0A8C5M9B2_9ANUR